MLGAFCRERWAVTVGGMRHDGCSATIRPSLLRMARLAIGTGTGAGSLSLALRSPATGPLGPAGASGWGGNPESTGGS